MNIEEARDLFREHPIYKEMLEKANKVNENILHPDSFLHVKKKLDTEPESILSEHLRACNGSKYSQEMRRLANDLVDHMKETHGMDFYTSSITRTIDTIPTHAHPYKSADEARFYYVLALPNKFHNLLPGG